MALPGLARRRRCRMPLRSLLFHCRLPAPSPRGPFPRRLGVARRLCRRAVGQGLVATGRELRARGAAADNCVVEKTPRDRRATACRSVCARERRFAQPPGGSRPRSMVSRHRRPPLQDATSAATASGRPLVRRLISLPACRTGDFIVRPQMASVPNTCSIRGPSRPEGRGMDERSTLTRVVTDLPPDGNAGTTPRSPSVALGEDGPSRPSSRVSRRSGRQPRVSTQAPNGS